jgi:hypothetical protein
MGCDTTCVGMSGSACWLVPSRGFAKGCSIQRCWPFCSFDLPPQDWASCVVQQASQGALDVTAAAAANGSAATAAIAAASMAPATPRRLRVADSRQQQQQQQQIELQQVTSPGMTTGCVSPVNLLVAGVPLLGGHVSEVMGGGGMLGVLIVILGLLRVQGLRFSVNP